jgi:hypothetical protein
MIIETALGHICGDDDFIYFQDSDVPVRQQRATGVQQGNLRTCVSAVHAIASGR